MAHIHKSPSWYSKKGSSTLLTLSQLSILKHTRSCGFIAMEMMVMMVELRCLVCCEHSVFSIRKMSLGVKVNPEIANRKLEVRKTGSGSCTMTNA